MIVRGIGIPEELLEKCSSAIDKLTEEKKSEAPDLRDDPVAYLRQSAITPDEISYEVSKVVCEYYKVGPYAMKESDLSLRPRPGETPADVIARVTEAAKR